MRHHPEHSNRKRWNKLGRKRHDKRTKRKKEPPRASKDLSLGTSKLITFPPELDLSNFARDLLEIIHRTRVYALREDKKTIWDLSKVHRITAGVIIKLHAEAALLKSRSRFGSAALKIIPPHGYSGKFLDHIGFFEADNNRAAQEGVLPIRTGTKGRKEIKGLLDQMNTSVYSDRLNKNKDYRMALHMALSEAVQNVEDHAYKDQPERADFVRDHGPRWWIMGNTFGQTLYLVLFDKGIGIPRTISRHRDAGTIRGIISKLTGQGGGPDSSSVRAAMEYSTSRHHGGGRGTGLASVKQFVDSSEDGHLIIVSNKAYYSYSAGEERTKELSRSMHGTLIQWKMDLSSCMETTGA